MSFSSLKTNFCKMESNFKCFFISKQSISRALQTLYLTILPVNSYREIPMPPRTSGTSLRGRKKYRKRIETGSTRAISQKEFTIIIQAPTQARSFTQKPKIERLSTQIVSIKPQSSTQELQKNPTLKQIKADYAFPIKTLLALQKIGLTCWLRSYGIKRILGSLKIAAIISFPSLLEIISPFIAML